MREAGEGRVRGLCRRGAQRKMCQQGRGGENNGEGGWCWTGQEEGSSQCDGDGFTKLVPAGAAAVRALGCRCDVQLQGRLWGG